MLCPFIEVLAGRRRVFTNFSPNYMQPMGYELMFNESHSLCDIMFQRDLDCFYPWDPRWKADKECPDNEKAI